MLACAAYVDLNPIRAAMAQTLEESEFTSVQKRIAAMVADVAEASQTGPPLCHEAFAWAGTSGVSTAGNVAEIMPEP